MRIEIPTNACHKKRVLKKDKLGKITNDVATESSYYWHTAATNSDPGFDI